MTSQSGWCAMLLVVLFVAVPLQQAHASIFSYTVTTDPALNEQIGNLAVDIRNIESLTRTSVANYAQAYNIYTSGNASLNPSGATLRSFKNLVTTQAITTSPIFKTLSNFWGTISIPDEYVTQAILGQGDFGLSNVVNAVNARSEGATIGLQAMHSPILMFQNLESALDRCRAGDMEHAMHLWDNAWSYYTGRDAMGRGRGRMFFYLVTELCQDACTCNSHHDDTIINNRIIDSFGDGGDGINEGNCDVLATAISDIRKRYVTALVQGVVRELYRSDPQNIDMATISNSTKEDLMRRRVEGYTYLMGALPFISQCSPSLATRLQNNLRFASTNYMQEGWRSLVDDLRAQYNCLGIVNCEIGGYCIRSGGRGSRNTTLVIPTNCPTLSPTTAAPTAFTVSPTAFPVAAVTDAPTLNGVLDYAISTNLALNSQLEHLAQDVRDIQSLTRTNVARFELALAIYQNGNSSITPNGGGYRSLKGLVTTDAAVNSDTFRALKDYWGRTTVPDEYVSQAIQGQGDFGHPSVVNAVDARSEAATTGLQAMHSPLLMMQHMEEAVYRCQTGETQWALHLWDHAFAYYTGMDATGRGRGRMFFYMVTELCQDSCTCSNHHADTIINGRIIESFIAGRDALNSGSCNTVASTLQDVRDRHLSALVQGVTRELYRSDPKNIDMQTISNSTKADLMRRRVEGYTYLMGALPYIAKCSPSLATRLQNNLHFVSGNYMQEGWSSLVDDLRAQYACLGLLHCEVGGYCVRSGGRGRSNTTIVIPTNCPTAGPTTSSPSSFTLTPTSFPVAAFSRAPTLQPVRAPTSAPFLLGADDFTIATQLSLNEQVNNLAIDVRDIETLCRTSVAKFTRAYQVYSEGNSSIKTSGNGFRSLRNLVTVDAITTTGIYKFLNNYWGRNTVPDEYVTQAIMGQGDFAAATVANAVDARAEAAGVGLQALHSPILMLQTMEQAVDQCRQLEMQRALNLWDNAYAFFTGKDATGRGRGRMFFYMVTELCQDACTCNSHHDDTIINSRIIESFIAGRDGFNDGHCDSAAGALADVRKRYVTALAQGITRELYRSDPQNIDMATISNSTKEALMRRRVEGYTYLMGALPFISQCSPSLATRLQNNLRFASTNYMQEGWRSLVDDFRSIFSCLGVQNCEIGGYCVRSGSRGNTTSIAVIPIKCSTSSPVQSTGRPTSLPPSSVATGAPTNLRTSPPSVVRATSTPTLNIGATLVPVQASTSSEDERTSVSSVVGGTLGGIAAIGVVCGAVFFMFFRTKKRRVENAKGEAALNEDAVPAPSSTDVVSI